MRKEVVVGPTKKTWDVEETRQKALPVLLQFDHYGFSSLLMLKVPHNLFRKTQVYVAFWGDQLVTTWLKPGWHEVVESRMSVSKEYGFLRTVRLQSLPLNRIDRPYGPKYSFLMVRVPNHRLAE